jgi:hypothetical protein
MLLETELTKLLPTIANRFFHRLKPCLFIFRLPYSLAECGIIEH